MKEQDITYILKACSSSVQLALKDSVHAAENVLAYHVSSQEHCKHIHFIHFNECNICTACQGRSNHYNKVVLVRIKLVPPFLVAFQMQNEEKAVSGHVK